jgi:hypothetical protein
MLVFVVRSAATDLPPSGPIELKDNQFSSQWSFQPTVFSLFDFSNPKITVFIFKNVL